MLQIRISTPNFASGVAFTDPIILDGADNISLVLSVTLGQESISFTLPISDPKSQFLSERKYGSEAFLRWWECWDTETNERLGYGAIDDIDDSTGDTLKISGPSRHSVLRDFSKTLQTFYYPIDKFLDDLRYENIAGEPRATTLINDSDGSDYHGLSKRTKDNAIDENIGYISPGRDTPARGQLKTDSYWSGTGRADYLTIDLGDDYTISKTRTLLPWWGGLTINNNRVYEWSLSYSSDGVAFTTLYDTGPGMTGGITNPSTGGRSFYMGETGFGSDQSTLAADAITARFWKINIADTHARYAYHLDGNNFSGSHTDEWDWECGGSDTFQGDSRQSPSTGTINKVTLKPDNDCYASVVEFEADRKIIDRDFISNVYYQQIDNENLQITYDHNADATETIDTTAANTRKYEPGVKFRKATFSWTSVTSSELEVFDEYNTRLYATSTGSGSHTLKTPANTRLLRFVGSPDVVVTSSDCWLGKLDPLSFEGRYSYTTVIGDTATLRFRGVSIKWFATVPDTVTAAEVSIEIRSRGTGTWSSWSTLEPSFTVPTNISATRIWQIQYESGSLSFDTTYEIRLTNLNGGYLSIDAFAGYWSASFQQLNEDDPRFYVRFPNDLVQRYDPTYSNQSIYEYPTTTPAFTREVLNFKGDRAIVYSLKKNGAGTIKMALAGTSGQIPIPGGDADGGLTVNLDTSANHTIPQAIIFDTDEIFGGLDWGYYALSFYQRNDSPGSMYLDGVGIHGESGLSTKFETTTNLEILQDTAEALQVEPTITEAGIRVVPRIGTDTNEVIREGANTVISIDDVKDVSQVATMLQVTGSDIDGLPLTAVVEDRISRKLFGRTIQRSYDLRNVADYFTLIGAARTELVKRRRPQNRVTITTSALPIEVGDSFTAVKKLIQLKLRAMSITRNQSRSGGTTYNLDCIEWPLDRGEASPSAPPLPEPINLVAMPGDEEVELDW